MWAVRKPTYTPEEHLYLAWVPFLLSFSPTGIHDPHLGHRSSRRCGWIFLCLLLATFKLTTRIMERWAIGRSHSLHRLSSAPGAPDCRWYRSAMLGRWRKATYESSRIVRWLDMKSASQLVVIVLSTWLNFPIAGLGSELRIVHGARE